MKELQCYIHPHYAYSARYHLMRANEELDSNLRNAHLTNAAIFMVAAARISDN